MKQTRMGGEITKRNLTVAATVAILTILLTLTPISYASTGENPIEPIEPIDAQMILESGFIEYASFKGVALQTLSEQGANDLFMQFIQDEPQYASVLSDYTYLTLQYYEPLQEFNVSYDELVGGEVIEVVNTWNETIDGVQYTVKLSEVMTSDETTVYKASYYSENGEVQDPYIYVTHAYLYVWVLWWRITTGEFSTVQFRYMKNAGGINEASRLIYRIKQNLYNMLLGVGVLCAALAPFTYGMTAIPGVFAVWMVNSMINELTAAYDNTANYLQIIWRVSWNYAGVGSWFDLHTIWGDGSWHMIGFPNIDLIGYTTQLMTQAFTGLGNTYGYNRWVWVGTYYG